MDDVSAAVAEKELLAYVKEIGSKDALTLGGFVSSLRAMPSPPITGTLSKFIKLKTNRQLKKIIIGLLVASYGGNYTGFKLEDGWNRIRKKLFWYYYFTDKDFLNIYSIKNDDLPLYVGYEFKNEEDKKLFLKRLQLANISAEEA